MSGPQAGVRRARIITVSDGVAAGEREDGSGPALRAMLEGAGFAVADVTVVRDGTVEVASAVTAACAGFHGLVVTTGGTGFGPRDKTPEGTGEVLERLAPGLAEAMRRASPLGRLSRGVAGTRGEALVVNVPGSPRGATESLSAVLDVIPHALDLMAGGSAPHP